MSWELVSETGGPTRKFPWWIPMTVGIFMIVAGLGLLLWPFVAASWLLVVLFGSALIANGLALIVAMRPSGPSFGAGVLLIIAGVLSILFSEFTVNVLVTFVGGTVMLIGIFWLVGAVRMSGKSAGLLAPLLVTFGGLASLIWPSVALAIVAVVGGLIMLVIGAIIVLAARTLRKAMNQRG